MLTHFLTISKKFWSSILSPVFIGIFFICFLWHFQPATWLSCFSDKRGQSEPKETYTQIDNFFYFIGLICRFFYWIPAKIPVYIVCQQMCYCADVSNIQWSLNIANTQILNLYFKSDLWGFFFLFRLILLLKCPDFIFFKYLTMLFSW